MKIHKGEFILLMNEYEEGYVDSLIRVLKDYDSEVVLAEYKQSSHYSRTSFLVEAGYWEELEYRERDDVWEYAGRRWVLR